MTNDRRYRADDDLQTHLDTSAAAGAPGRLPATARLSGSRTTNSIVFRVESAEAARELGSALAGAFGPRDANGVAASADDHVDRASRSSGMSLPDELRSRFESSLGVDLSSVRLHNGGDSETAAKSVGAKAYTVGQDIHFGAGHYDQTSTAGQHLIAHEVAHTVQQAGAAPTRQNKLEVSTPHDAVEVEADRAADSMISGAPAQLAAAASSLARKPIETRSKIEEGGDAGGACPGYQGGLGESHAAADVKVRGKGDAEQLKAEISSWQGRLAENHGMDASISANIKTIGMLDNFVMASSVVGTAVSGFQSLFASTKSEYGRLVAMASSPAFNGAFAKPDEKDGGQIADEHAQRAEGGVGNSAELTERAAKMAATTGPNGGENKALKTALDDVKNSEKEAQASATGVADAATNATANMSSLNAAQQTLAGVKARSESEAIKQAFEKAKAEYEKQKKSIEDAMKVLDVIKDVGQAVAAGPEGLAGAADKYGTAIFKEAVEAVLMPLPPDAKDEAKAARMKEDADVKTYNGSIGTFNAEGKKVAATVKALAEAAGKLQRTKAEHKRKVKSLGQAFDAADVTQKDKKHAPGEAGTYETIAIFQGQADAFLVTADATKQVGERDLTWRGQGAGGDASPTESASKSASNALKAANASVAYKIEDQWVDVSPNSPDETGGSGGPGYDTAPMQRVKRAVLVRVPVSVQGDIDDESKLPETHTGMQGSVEVALQELEEYTTQIKAYKTKLGSVIGLS